MNCQNGASVALILISCSTWGIVLQKPGEGELILKQLGSASVLQGLEVLSNYMEMKFKQGRHCMHHFCATDTICHNMHSIHSLLFQKKESYFGSSLIWTQHSRTTKIHLLLNPADALSSSKPLQGKKKLFIFSIFIGCFTIATTILLFSMHTSAFRSEMAQAEEFS